jgi:hypothetical protein
VNLLDLPLNLPNLLQLNLLDPLNLFPKRLNRFSRGCMASSQS